MSEGFFGGAHALCLEFATTLKGMRRGREEPPKGAGLFAVETPQILLIEHSEAHVRCCQLLPFPFEYYVHGVVEEVGEVFDAVRGVRAGGAGVGAHVVVSELGGELWYVTALSLQLGWGCAMPRAWPVAAGGSRAPEVLILAAASRLAGCVKMACRGDQAALRGFRVGDGALLRRDAGPVRRGGGEPRPVAAAVRRVERSEAARPF